MTSRAEDLNFRNDLAVALHNEDLADQVLERMPVVPAHNLATKDDIADLRGELLGRMGELDGRFGQLEGKFGQLEGKFGELRADVADKMRIQTWIMTGMMGTAIGSTAAIVSALA